MIVWIKQDEHHYVSANGRYSLYKAWNWHLQDKKYNMGIEPVATEPTLAAIKKEAARHARAQSFSERVKGVL